MRNAYLDKFTGAPVRPSAKQADESSLLVEGFQLLMVDILKI